MNKFATLIGTDRTTTKHEEIFKLLFDIAVNHKFVPPDNVVRVQRDQIPLDSWTLVLKEPDNNNPKFLLAVTAPKIPSMSPLPVRQTIDCPLFSVIVMDTYFGIWRDGDFSESVSTENVTKVFKTFLDTINK